MTDDLQGRRITHCPQCSTEAPTEGLYCGICGAHLQIATGDDPLVGTIIATRYRLVSRVATSPLATVYRGEHIGMGKQLAVKVIPAGEADEEGFADRFLEEFRRVSALSSVHTAVHLDFGRADGDLIYTVTEYIPGHDLSSMVRQFGPFSPARALRIMAQVCLSLAEANDYGIIHGRLKPENIVVTRTHEGQDFAKVLDYGYARLAEVRDESSLATAHRLQGTPHCMSPEQVMGKRLDGRSDVYSVGALLFWMITGGHMFTARTPVGVLKQHLTADPPSPSSRRPQLHIPPSVDDLISGCVRKDPKSRPLTAEELRAELPRIAAGL